MRVVSEPYNIDEHRVTVGASIGAAFYPENGATVDELLRAADQAMYGAKRAGKGRAHVSGFDKPGPPPYSFDARA